MWTFMPDWPKPPVTSHMILSRESPKSIMTSWMSSVSPEHQPYDLKIKLEKGSVPLSPRHLYLLSTLEQEALQKFIQENLNISFIHPSKLGHGVPVLFICKKDSSLCLCIDFHNLNKIMKKDCYPLLLINDLLDTSHKGCLYTKINLHHTYHLVCVVEGNESKTVFCMKYRSFKWLVIPEGLTNAPTAFQHFMNDIFSNMLDISVIVYLDDILVYSGGNLAEHWALVHEVLHQLHNHKLFVKVEKYTKTWWNTLVTSSCSMVS